MDFPSNSHNPLGSKESQESVQEKQIDKVVQGRVIKKNKGIGKRFKELFIGGESKSAARYVLEDVLIPAWKKLIVDAAATGMERLIYGDSGPRRRPGMMDYGRTRVQYNTPIDRGYSSRERSAMLPNQPPHRTSSRGHSTIDIILSSRQDAEAVLEGLSTIVQKYNSASVADLNELLGEPSTFVDNRWGWKSVAYSDIRQVREGYLLILPPIEEIEV